MDLKIAKNREDEYFARQEFERRQKIAEEQAAHMKKKELEELKAKLKHVKKKQKKAPPTRAEKEKELARHAVESWTKYDKARWKKERRRHDKNDES